MALQVKRTGAADYGLYIKALVCGEPGSGKTLTASTWPNPLYANAEGGLMSVASLNLPTVDITNTSVLLELKGTLAQDPAIREKVLGIPVETVIIDTIDEIGRLLVKERLEQQNKDAMAIQDWGWFGEQMRSIVRAYRNLPMNVIFNCHVKSVEDADSGTQFFRPAIQGAMGDEIAGYVDIAAVLTARPTAEVINGKTHRRIVRVMQTFPDVKRPWIKDRSGKLPMEFKIDFATDYQRMHEFVFGAGAPQPDVQQTIVQPAVQVAPTTEEAEIEAEDVVDIRSDEEKKESAKPKKRAAAKAKVPESVPEPEPEPEPAVQAEVPSEPTQEAESEPVPVPDPGEPEVEPEPVKEAPAESVAALGLVCDKCDGVIESQDQADLAYIRFRKKLCRSCFADERKR